MKLLLDTNVLIWWLEDNPRLGGKVRHMLANPANIVLASTVSLWEITVKWRVGKMHLPGSAFAARLDEQNVALIGVETIHIKALEELPLHHGDPFDHLLLAQAMGEGATIVTSDRMMTQYDVPCISLN